VILEAAEIVEEPHELATLLVAGAVIGGEGGPDPAALALGLPGSGVFDPAERVQFHPAWFVAEEFSRANPCDIHAALRSMLSGGPPAPLLPASSERLREGGAFALLGTVRQSTADLQQGGDGRDDGHELEADRGGEAPAADGRSDAFDVWAEGAEASQPGLLVIVEPTSPSQFDPASIEELGREIGPGDDPDGAQDAIEELVDFVEAARAETADQQVTCSVAQLEGALDVEVRATSGALLDRRAFAVGTADALQALRSLDGVTVEEPR
jgi:hypothetical protein